MGVAAAPVGMVKRWSHVRVLYGLKKKKKLTGATRATVIMPFWANDTDQSLDVT